jgi:hypothetical protein
MKTQSCQYSEIQENYPEKLKLFIAFILAIAFLQKGISQSFLGTTPTSNIAATVTWPTGNANILSGDTPGTESISPLKGCGCNVLQTGAFPFEGEEKIGINILIETGSLSNPLDLKLEACTPYDPWKLIQKNMEHPMIAPKNLASVYHIDITSNIENPISGLAPLFKFKDNSSNEPWTVIIWIGNPDDNPIATGETWKYARFGVNSTKPQVVLGGLLSVTGSSSFNNNMPITANNGGYQNWLVNSDLNIDMSLFANPPQGFPHLKIMMQPGVKITVSNAATFTMREADLIGCDFLHEGILVNSGATLDMNKSSILDANTALTVQNTGTASVNRSRFTNNYRGILLDGKLGISNPPILAQVDLNTFDRVGAMKKMFIGTTNTTSYGITAKNAAPISLIANFFDNVTDGILLDHTDLYGQQNNFKNLSIGVTSKYSVSLILDADLTRISKNRFTNVGVGIMVNKVHNVTAYKTKMTNVNRGIIIANCKGSLVKLEINSIYAKRTGILGLINPRFDVFSKISGNIIEIDGSSAGFTNGKGISLTSAHEYLNIANNDVSVINGNAGIQGNGLKGVNIYSNTVKIANSNLTNVDCVKLENTFETYVGCNSLDRSFASHDHDVANSITRGIYSSAGTSNLITCNTVNDLGFGMLFNDAAMDIIVQGNNFGNLFHGLEMSKNSFIGPQFEQGTGTGFGNTWENNTESPNGIGFGAFHNSTDQSIVDLSQFFVNPNPNEGCNGNPAFLPTTNGTMNNIDWFQTNQDCFVACTGACPPTIVPGFSPNSPESFKELIANGELNRLPIPRGMMAKSKMQLYRVLDKQPQLLENTKLKEFQNTESATAIGAFYSVEKAIKNLPTLSPSDVEIANSQSINLENAMEAITQINDVVSPNVTVRNQFFEQANVASSQINAIDASLLMQTAVQIELIKLQNQALNANEIWEVNQKSVNDWTLSALNGEELNLELAPEVFAIANQCPLEGGDAVYEARGLYATFFDDLLEFDDNRLCHEVNERQNKVEKPDNGLTIYPNPVDDILYIKGNDFENAYYSISNNLGQIVKNGKVTSSSIITSDLFPGLYLFSITDPISNKFIAYKFIVER